MTEARKCDECGKPSDHVLTEDDGSETRLCDVHLAERGIRVTREPPQEDRAKQRAANNSTLSGEGRQTLIISFIGGLAANIGLVLIVGGAVAIDRVINNSTFTAANLAYIYFGAMGALACIAWVLTLFYVKLFKRFLGESSRFAGYVGMIGKYLIWFYILVLGISLLIFLGVAAGLGK